MKQGTPPILKICVNCFHSSLYLRLQASLVPIARTFSYLHPPNTGFLFFHHDRYKDDIIGGGEITVNFVRGILVLFCARLT